MPSNDSRLGGRPRTRLNAAVRARTDHPVCPLCGYPIDRQANRMGRRHPLASVIDEWLPRARGGDVNLDNCVETHSLCNGIKGDRWPVTPDLNDRCRRRIEHELQGAPNPTRSRTW